MDDAGRRDSGDATEGAVAAQAIRALLGRHVDRHDERRILDILGASSAAALNHLLVTLDLHEVVHSTDDRIRGPKHRTALLELLCVQRLEELAIDARAALVGALQRGRTGKAAEQAIRDVFVGTRGSALTALKNAIDGATTYRDLHQLVFADVDDETVRAEILAHVAAEAEAAPAGEVKILSDIDDTFYANWKDERYPAKTVYPGVLAFYRELDRGPLEQPGRSGDLTFVTARPGDRVGLVEDATRKALRDLGLEAATVLTGSFRRLIGNRSIAKKKLANFEEYRRLYPEYAFVFVGDSGQGDIHFGEGMIASAPAAVRGVFIHDVVNTPSDARARLRERGVHLFDTYVGATRTAFEIGLVAKEAIERVATEALRDFERIAFEDEARREARRVELVRDAEAGL